MKTANVYDIERALQQPITPQQRQTAAANNPLAAIIAQRLDGVEGSLRQKLQTPPPPQGTVMNQYFQWPQQEMQYGLAQPGLEELAQQYASGGLVAFANGGLASMLPMGYAGEADVPVFNGYAGGGSPLRDVFPYTDFDEEEYEAGEGENFGDVGTGTYGITKQDLEADKRASAVAQEREDAKRRVAEREAMERYSAGPGDIIGKGVEGVKKLGSTLSDMAFIKDPAWEARQAEKKQRDEDYYKTTSPPPNRAKPAEQGIAAVPTEPGFADKAKAVVSSIGDTLRGSTQSSEDIKREKQQEAKSKKTAAAVAKAEAPAKAQKAAYSPAAAQGTTVVTNGVIPQVGTPGLEPIPAEEQRKREYAEAARAVEEEMRQPNTPVAQTPERQAVSRVVNSNLTADQQIAALEKYFQTDTSEAMRIKGEMEKENARAGNLGILTALAGAVGAGLGTYGPGARRMGAGLMQFASGVMGEQQQAEARQAKLNDLALKVKEMQGSGEREAAKLLIPQMMTQRAKGAAAEDELRKALILKQLDYRKAMDVANVNKASNTEAAEIRAGQGPKPISETDKLKIASDIVSKIKENIKLPPGTPAWTAEYNRQLGLYLQANPNIREVLTGITGIGGGGVTPQGPTIGTVTRQGGFAPQG